MVYRSKQSTIRNRRSNKFDFNNQIIQLLKKCAIQLNLEKVLRNLQHAIKTASKITIQKTAETTGDLIGNKVTDKITSISKSTKNASKELHSKTDENEIKIPKE